MEELCEVDAQPGDREEHRGEDAQRHDPEGLGDVVIEAPHPSDEDAGDEGAQHRFQSQELGQ
jgi:hypothetical protein